MCRTDNGGYYFDGYWPMFFNASDNTPQDVLSRLAAYHRENGITVGTYQLDPVSARLQGCCDLEEETEQGVQRSSECLLPPPLPTPIPSRACLQWWTDGMGTEPRWYWAWDWEPYPGFFPDGLQARLLGATSCSLWLSRVICAFVSLTLTHHATVSRYQSDAIFQHMGHTCYQ